MHSKSRMLVVFFFCLLTGLQIRANDTDCYLSREISVISKDQKISPYFKTHTNVSYQQCVFNSAIMKICKSINYNPTTKECQISTVDTRSTVLINAVGWFHIQENIYAKYQGQICAVKKPCPDHDYCISLCQPPWYQCTYST